eukprot:SAG31_NODE_875_length_11316_cov_8.924044_1_plen_99_part_00
MPEARRFEFDSVPSQYFLHCNPPSAIYASDDMGVSLESYEPAASITNHKVHSLPAYTDEAGGQICACTDGTGVQCVNASIPMARKQRHTAMVHVHRYI